MERNKRSKNKEKVHCGDCGKPIKVQRHRVASPACYGGCKDLKTKTCVDCGRQFKARPTSRRETCGDTCPAKYIFFPCINCHGAGKRPKEFGSGNFCGELCRIEWECRIHNLEFDRSAFLRTKYSKKRKRMMANGDDIDRMDLFDHYNWVCHLCHEAIDPHLRHPDPMSATIDHVVPLDQGGRHRWENVKPAHKCCNEQKGARAP